MYRAKSVCIVIPAFNEASQIRKTIAALPEFVDRVVVVDDASRDATAEVVEAVAEESSRVLLLRHRRNQGCGGALATGCKWAAKSDYDVVVRMDADGQMDPADLPAILDPVVTGAADYAKGNRFFTGEAFRKIPRVKYFGNAFLSLLTKIASGYWHIADFQSGYTAAARSVLETVDWDRMYKRYGQPNDLLIRLNVCDFKVADVPVRPLYGVGERSDMKISRVMFSIGWLLLRMFFWRMKEKYVIRDFHPLVFFYLLGGFFGLSTLILTTRMILYWYLNDHIPSINALAAMFSFMSASLFTLFAMWFDMEANKDLKVRWPRDP